MHINKHIRAYNWGLNCVSLIAFPIVTHPSLTFLSLPNNSSLLRPKQNLSIISYISIGLAVHDKSNGSSDTITSASKLA